MQSTLGRSDSLVAQSSGDSKGSSSPVQTPAPSLPDGEQEVKSETSDALQNVSKPLTQAEELEKQNRKFQALESLARVVTLLEAIYVDEKATDPETLVEKALKGMTSQLDPHTVYLPAAKLTDFSQDTSGKFGGIGISLQPQSTYFEITEVFEKTPAGKAGLKPGDRIVGVNDVKITPQNLETLLGQLRGLPGTTVRIDVITAADAAKPVDPKNPIKPKSLTLTRELFRTPSVVHHSLSTGYAYIRLSVFQEDSAEQVHKALLFYESQNGGKLDGLILDLRHNPGGLLDQAIRIVDFFVDSGIIVSTIGRDPKKQEVEYATVRSTHPYMPLVVLVNEGSASASEIVAGALQDHNRALVMGTQTFGKGSVQSIVPLPNGGGLKVTVARYYTPKGRSIQAKGISPDIPVALQASSPSKQGPKKEADLDGHIEAKDLDVGSNSAFKKESEAWPKELKNDNQVNVAYTYLRSWSRFAQSGSPIPKPNPPPKTP